MRLYDLDDKYSLIQYINEDCVRSYRMKVQMERIDEQFFKPWSRYLEEATLAPEQIQQMFKSAHDQSQAGGQNSTMLGKVIDKIVPDSLMQKLSDSLPEPDANAVNDPQFTANATAAVNKLPVDEQTKGGLMKIVQQGAKDPAIQGVILALVGGVLGGMIQKAGPALNAFGLGGTALAAVSGALVAGGVAVAAAKIQGKGWKEAFKGAIKPALAGAAGAVVGKLAADFVSGLGTSADKTINDTDPEATHQAGGGLPDADAASNNAADAKAASEWAVASPAERAQIEKVTGMSPEQLQAAIPNPDIAALDKASLGQSMKMDPMLAQRSGINVANEPVIPGQPLSQNQMATVDLAKSMGNTPSPEVQAAYDLAKQSGPAAATAAPPYGANMDPAYLQRVVDAQGTSGVRFKISPEDAQAALNYQQQQAAPAAGTTQLNPNQGSALSNAIRKGKVFQSHVPRGNKLSEGQVYLVIKRTTALNTQLLREGYMIAEAGVLQKAGSWLKTKAQNLTQNVTADKLTQAWKAAGSPTDSNAVADIMTKAGVNADIVSKIYTDMKLPAPGKAGTADKVEPTLDPNAPAPAAGADGKVEPTMDPANPAAAGAVAAPADTWKYQVPNSDSVYDVGVDATGQLLINMDGEWETVDDAEDKKAIMATKTAAPAQAATDPAAKTAAEPAGDTGAAAGTADAAAAPVDFEAVKAMVLKLPTDRKVRMVKYMQNQLKVA